jgi:hypothetical protein
MYSLEPVMLFRNLSQTSSVESSAELRSCHGDKHKSQICTMPHVGIHPPVRSSTRKYVISSQAG